jgi:hypothetical protein
MPKIRTKKKGMDACVFRVVVAQGSTKRHELITARPMRAETIPDEKNDRQSTNINALGGSLPGCSVGPASAASVGENTEQVE